ANNVAATPFRAAPAGRSSGACAKSMASQGKIKPVSTPGGPGCCILPAHQPEDSAMSPPATLTKPAPAQPDLATIKQRQRVAWSSGDYAIVGTTLQIVGEQLCEALDLRPGSKVLDVAAGNGNVTLAAARRWCAVTSTDYVQALLERGRALRRRCFHLRRDVHGRPGQSGRRTHPRLQAGGKDRPRQLDARRLHRPGVQDARQISAATGRREIARAVGNPRPSR